MRTDKPEQTSTSEMGEILTGLREWRLHHPRATLAEIERETMKRMAKLQARMVEELSQGMPAEEQEVPSCPECGARMQRRGAGKRQLQGSGGQAICLRREFWVCPACGAGIFPPG